MRQLASQITKWPPEPAAAGMPEPTSLEDTLLGGDLARRVERAGIVDLRHLVIGEAENLAQDFVGVLAEQRRALYLRRAIRHLDGFADREVFAALGVIDLDHGAGGPQRWILDQLLHRQDR